MKLKGRRILITGAGSGIAQTTAKLFAAEGASLAFIDRDEMGLKKTAELCQSAKTFSRCIDLSNKRAIAPAVQELTNELGGLDGIVNAAGFTIMGGIEDATLEDWELSINVMLTAPMLVCKAGVPALKSAALGMDVAATIVNIASGAGIRPLPNNLSYCCAKAGVVMLSKQMALDLAPHNIRVNAVCPGVVDTPLARAHAGNPHLDLWGAVKNTYAMGRVAQPLEIARSILYLTCSDSSFVTGTAHAVDGGRTFS